MKGSVRRRRVARPGKRSPTVTGLIRKPDDLEHADAMNCSPRRAVPSTRALTAGWPVLPALALLPTLAVLAALVGLAGCRTGPGAVVARDSAGIRVVDNREPEWSPEEAWRLGDPVLDLGGPDAAGPTAFQWVTTAFFTESGVLVVVESAGDIKLFGGDGHPLRTIGGNGDGPGEFRMVAGAGLVGDSVWVYDYSHRRLTYLGLDGGLGSVHSLEGQDLPLMPVGRLGDGFLLAGTYQPGAASAAGRLGLRRDTVDYRVFGARGERGDAIARLAAREYVVGEEDGRLTMATPPFAHHAQDATRTGEWVHGSESRRGLEVRAPDGALRTLIRWPGADLTLGESAVRAEIERRVAQLAGDPAGNRRFLTELDHPAMRPAHGAVSLGPEERIWVATAPGIDADGTPFETPGWHVFGPDGRWLGTVSGPERFRITQVGADRVVGVWQDALDVEHVQVRPLLRP